MKINSKQYAQALYESVQGNSEKEIEEVVKNFVKILADSGKISQAEKIVLEFLGIVILGVRRNCRVDHS